MSIKKKMLVAIAACALLLLVGEIITSSHSGDDVEGSLTDHIAPVSTYAASPLQEVVFPEVDAFGDVGQRHEAWKDYYVEADFVADLNTFAYQTAVPTLSESEGNVNYSPLSLYYALALAASGAEGQTESELLSLLGAEDQAALAVQCSNLYRRLYEDNEVGKLKISNSIWMDEKADWKDDFIKSAAKNFYAELFSVDFSAPETGGSMARWIADHTNGSLNPGMAVNPKQMLSILNTVYFYDEWTDLFDEAKTAGDTFYRSFFDRIRCDFMNRTDDSAGFFKGDSFTRASLSLKNGGSMVFILPDKGVSVKQLLSSPDKMKNAFEGGDKGRGEIVWKIPKFRFGAEFDLVDTLQNLGVKEAFKQGADFSSMTEQVAFITNIRQQTHIGIDEKGVEASAFTQIVYEGAALPQGRAEMILDRPFLYGITASNNTLLFVGICENPAEE